MSKYQDRNGKRFEISEVFDPVEIDELGASLKEKGLHAEADKTFDPDEQRVSKNLTDTIVYCLTATDKVNLLEKLNEYQAKLLKGKAISKLNFKIDLNEILYNYLDEDSKIPTQKSILKLAEDDFDQHDFSDVLNGKLNTYFADQVLPLDYIKPILDFLEKDIDGFKVWHLVSKQKDEDSYAWEIVDSPKHDIKLTNNELSAIVYGKIYDVYNDDQDCIKQLYGKKAVSEYIKENQLSRIN